MVTPDTELSAADDAIGNARATSIAISRVTTRKREIIFDDFLHIFFSFFICNNIYNIILHLHYITRL